jgi:putative transposase
VPRIHRVLPPGVPQHVLNRGNERKTIFYKPGDYMVFVRLMAEAQQRYPVEILEYCLMPNHFHFVLVPPTEESIPAYMHWLMNAHIRQYHQHYETCGLGHIYQGRYKNFPIQTDRHLLTVLRYVVANPLRACLARRAQEWRWSSASADRSITRPELSEGPVARPRHWVQLVNEAEEQLTLARVRQSVKRGAPYGDAYWTEAFAEEHGLQFTRRPPGRPPRNGDTHRF